MSNELKNINNESNLLRYKEEFETVYSIIATHRKRVVRVVNNESMSMVWEVGENTGDWNLTILFLTSYFFPIFFGTREGNELEKVD